MYFGCWIFENRFADKGKDLKNIAINLKLLIGEYPDLDDDQIYIYGLGDRSFSSNIETNQMIKPIFLLLHVPEKMKKLPNISTIIFQIYSFLCFICDIEIVVLNKNYYNDQIDIVKKINNISRLIFLYNFLKQ